MQKKTAWHALCRCVGYKLLLFKQLAVGADVNKCQGLFGFIKGVNQKQITFEMALKAACVFSAKRVIIVFGIKKSSLR